jgi:hypothetical protein
MGSSLIYPDLLMKAERQLLDGSAERNLFVDPYQVELH